MRASLRLLYQAVIFLISWVICIPAWAADEFDGIQCGANIPKALVGKRSSNARVVVLEKRHKDLDLKDLGGMEISDRLFLISLRICGSEYAELISITKKNLIRDVLPVPANSLRSPQFIGLCQVGGKDFPETVIAVLNNSEGQRPKGYYQVMMLRAKIAWNIDERLERFVAMPTEGLSCPVSGSYMQAAPDM